MHDERARKAHSLAHATGQFARIGRLETVEANQVDRSERTLPDLGRRKSQGFKSDLHVFKHG